MSDIRSANKAQIFLENGSVIGISFAPAAPSFTQVPSEWGKFSRLRSLKLQYSHPASLPPSFQDCVSLTDAAFDNIASDSIFAHFHHWKNLSHLSIKNTPLPPILPQNENPASLKYLECSHTHLHEIPKWILDLPMLVGVKLSHNNISSTSPLRHINHNKWEVLDLSHNPISEFRALDNLTGLRRINLSQTNCQSILPELLTIPNIIELNISHNSITSIPPDMIAKWPNLYYLDVSFNKIAEFPSFIFDGKLSFVNFAQNPLPASLTEFLKHAGLIHEPPEILPAFQSPRLPPINRDMLKKFLKDDFFTTMLTKIENKEPLDEYDQIYPSLIQVFPLIDAKISDKKNPTFQSLQEIYLNLIKNPIQSKNILL